MDSSYLKNIQDPIARAEAMRAQAVAQLIVDVADGVRDLVKGAAARVSAYRAYRRNYEVLAAMTDRELDDIGIGRGDIAAVARGFDPRRKAAIEVPAKDALTRRMAVASAFDQETAEQQAPANQDRRPAAAA